MTGCHRENWNKMGKNEKLEEMLKLNELLEGGVELLETLATQDMPKHHQDEVLAFQMNRGMLYTMFPGEKEILDDYFSSYSNAHVEIVDKIEPKVHYHELLVSFLPAGSYKE